MPNSSDVKIGGAYVDVIVERANQLEEFPPGADDALSAPEWIARIVKHVGRAVTREPEMFRSQMVRVAATALAAVEWHDRKYGR